MATVVLHDGAGRGRELPRSRPGRGDPAGSDGRRARTPSAPTSDGLGKRRAARLPAAHARSCRRRQPPNPRLCARRSSPARRRTPRAARGRQAPPRHQALERPRDPRRAGRAARLRPRVGARPRRAQSTSMHLVGTPAYMSPEQAAGRPVDRGERLVRRRRHAVRGADRAAALSGRSSSTCSSRSRTRSRRRRASSCPRFPNDLDALCRGLLRRDPDDRPAEDEDPRGSCAAATRQRVTRRPPPTAVGAPRPSSAAKPQLEALARRVRARPGGPSAVAVLVDGPRASARGARAPLSRGARAGARRRRRPRRAAATSRRRCRTRPSTAWSTRCRTI